MKIRFVPVILIVTIILAGFSTSCHRDRNKNLGSEKNPVVLSFMPSADQAVMDKNAKIIADALKKYSGYNVKTQAAKGNIAIINGLGDKKIDIAFINSLGYLLAHDWSGAEALLQLRGVDGNMDYRSALIVNAGKNIKSLEELNGKIVAYTDPFSMAGYLMPFYLFNEKGIKPKETPFLESYDEVVDAVYTDKADAGAIYYHKRDPYGRINDARARLVKKYSDILDKVTVLELTDTIPNTPVVFRKGLPLEAKKKLIEAFGKMSEDPAVIAAIGQMYDATGFGPADEQSFDKIREMLKKMGKEIKEVVPGGVTFYQKHIWEHIPEY